MSHHPLAIDIVELVDELSPGRRSTLAHIATCEPCRRGLVNIIQSNADYPDLFDRPPADDDTRPCATLFLALSVPGVDTARLDPDDVADRLAALMNLDVKRPIDHRFVIDRAEDLGMIVHDLIIHHTGSGPGGHEIEAPIRARRNHSYLVVVRRPLRRKRRGQRTKETAS